MMESRTCSLCSEILPDGFVAFCHSCGGPVIDNSILNAKSTASYDPSSKDWKPWREKPLIPKRNYKFRTEKPKPWYPALRVRQSRHLVAKRSTQPDLPPEPPAVEMDDPTGPSHEPFQDQVSCDNVPAVPRPVDPQFSSNDHPGDSVARLREVTYPLAAYEIDLPGNSLPLMMIISLVEQLFGEEGIPRIYWMKIAVVDDDGDEEQSTHQNASATNKLKASDFDTVYFSNSVVSLIYPFEDWIDLEKIDADQFYMTQHLQQALQFLPNRMLHSIVHDELLLSVGDVPDAEDSSFTVIRATVHVELRQSSWTSLSYGNSYGGISAAKIVTTLRKMELKLHEFTERIIFDTSLLECIGEVKVARSSPPISIPVNVRSQVFYRKRLDSKVAITSKEQLKSSGQATDLRLLIIPSQRQTALSSIPVLDITFDEQSLAALLSGKLEDELIACEGNEELWKIYLDRVLSMLRIENTQEFGLWYSLVGSFSAPVYTSQPWPEDAIDYSAIADE